MISIRVLFIFLFTILISKPANCQGGKKVEALKKMTSVNDVVAYTQRNGPTSARLGNFSRLIDSVEYKEIEANYKVGDIFYYKKSTIKILGNTVEPLSRCQYIVLDGNKMSKSQIDSLRSELLSKFGAGMPFKNLANQFSMEGKLNGGDSGWFHKSRMGDLFCKELTYKKLGEIYLFDNVEKNKYYVVLKTHAELYADSWVYVAM
jgi:hypothetical protein